MEEPPDPGGTVPPAGCFVTIENESVDSIVNMDIDVSLTSRTIATPPPASPSTSNGNKRRKKGHAIHGNDIHSADSEVLAAPLLPKNDSKIANNAEIPKDKSPSFVPIGRSQYDVTDCAPYIVHVQRPQLSSNDGSTLHPITFGRFLKKHNIKNIINGSVKRIGRNRITLSFLNHNDANSFINHNSLSNDNLKAFIPTFSITRMGLVRGVPTEWSPEEIIENVNIPTGCGKILKVRRLNYKVNVGGSPTWKPSQTVVITFDGKILPNRIYICYNALAVELYAYPTIQCFNCCRFGHTKMQCRSKPKCYKCGQEHSGDTCNREDDCATCCLCSGLHYATNKSCPEFVRQKNIKLTMAENCISYVEATKLHPPVGKSYADVLSTPKPTLVEKPILYNIQPQSPSRTSYQKTVTSKPRSPYVAPKGYDRVAHHELIKDYNIPLGPNGCAYARPNDQEPVRRELSHQTLTNIISSLIDTLTMNNILLPSNVAPLIEALNNSPHNCRSEVKTFRIDAAGRAGGQSLKDCPVELSQRS